MSHVGPLFQIVHYFVSADGQTESSCTTQQTCLDEHKGTALISRYTRIIVTVQTWGVSYLQLNFRSSYHCWISLGRKKHFLKLIFIVVDTLLMENTVSEDFPFYFYLCSSYLSVPCICTEIAAFSTLLRPSQIMKSLFLYQKAFLHDLKLTKISFSWFLASLRLRKIIREKYCNNLNHIHGGNTEMYIQNNL